MTDMAELGKRKQPLNLAIVHVDAEAFIANFLGWLEITAFIRALRAGEAAVPADGATPKLTAQQLKGGGAADVGADALFAFCMTAALKGDKTAVDRVESGLADSLGQEFPGSFALWNFRGTIEAPVTLEDFVGQAGKKMLTGDKPPPPMRAKENWSAGLRFFEKARKSNFVREISILWRSGTANAGRRRWRRKWPSSTTSRTAFRSCARSWRKHAMMSPSSPICC